MCSRQDRTTELILFRASLLIAGTKPVVMRPLPVRTLRPRNPYPGNVNDVCSCEPRRLASWQYTIRVLSGYSASPTSLIRSWSVASTARAWRSLTQWITASSTERPDATPVSGRPEGTPGEPGAGGHGQGTT